MEWLLELNKPWPRGSCFHLFLSKLHCCCVTAHFNVRIGRKSHRCVMFGSWLDAQSFCQNSCIHELWHGEIKPRRPNTWEKFNMNIYVFAFEMLLFSEPASSLGDRFLISTQTHHPTDFSNSSMRFSCFDRNNSDKKRWINYFQDVSRIEKKIVAAWRAEKNKKRIQIIKTLVILTECAKKHWFCLETEAEVSVNITMLDRKVNFFI